MSETSRRSPGSLWKDLAGEKDILFGELAVAHGYVTMNELDTALAEQKDKHDRKIGQILYERGFISQEQLALLLLEQCDLCGTGRGPGRLGKYLILHEIGRGGMGIVWKGWDTELNRPVAIKTLNVGDEPERQRFIREARIAAKLNHPGIVPVHEVLEHEGNPCIVMGLVEGKALSPDSPNLSLRPALEIVRDVARTVQFAHDQGVTHRDLKPENLMLDRNGRVYVLDFGVAKIQRTASSLSVDGVAMGTPGYMPPEQADGRPERTGPHSDVYSLGATLYALVTGQEPFRGASPVDVMHRVLFSDPPAPRSIRPGLHRDVETIIQKAMEKEPSRRYSTIAAMGDDIDRFLRGEAILARPLGTVGRLARLARRNAILTGALAAVLVLLIAGVVVATALNRRATTADQRATTARSELTRRDRAQSKFEQGKRFFDVAWTLLYRRGASSSDAKPELAKAIPLFEEASGIDPTYAEPEHYLGRCHMMMNDGAAEAHFAESIRRNPGYVEAYYHRGMYAFQKGEERLNILADWKSAESGKQAQEDLERYAASSGSKELVKFARAVLAHLRGDHDTALSLCGELADDANLADEVYHLKGRSLFVQKKYAEAARAFKEAIDRRPLFVYAHLFLGMACERLNRPSEAAEAFAQGIKISPEYVEFYFGLARADAALGKTDEAEAAYGAVINRKPEPKRPVLALAYNQRGFFRHRQGRIDDSADDLREAIRLDNTILDGRALLVEILVGKGDLESAERGCAEIELVAPGGVYGWTSRARVLIARRDAKGAEAALSQAIAADPDTYVARVLRAKLLYDRGDVAGAEEDLQAAMRIDPARPEACRDLSTVYFARGHAFLKQSKWAEAISYLQRAHELRPNDARLLAHLGIAFRNNRQPREAIANWEAAIRLDPKLETEIRPWIEKGKADLDKK